MNEDEEAEYGLLMPFVTVQSKGGPHEDEAYCAGWEMGALDSNLIIAKTIGATIDSLVIKRTNLEQADLIGMKHGAHMTELPWDDDLDEKTAYEWVHVSFAFSEGV